MLFLYSVCSSTLGKTAMARGAGSGTCVLFFEVAAVEFTTSGHSFIIPRDPGTKDGKPVSGCFKLPATCRFDFGFVALQHSCARCA